MWPSESKPVGPFAHVLTWEGPARASQIGTLRYGDQELARRVADAGWTHLVYDRPADPGRFQMIFQTDGAPIDLVELFYVRGVEVHVYRFRRSLHPESPYERARMALREGDWADAHAHAREVIAARPDSSSAWSVLAEALRRDKQLDAAYAAFRESVRLDPWRLPAHVALAEFYGSAGRTRDALAHVRAARRAGRREKRSARPTRSFRDDAPRLAHRAGDPPLKGDATTPRPYELDDRRRGLRERSART